MTQYITFWVALNASPFCLPFGYTYVRAAGEELHFCVVVLIRPTLGSPVGREAAAAAAAAGERVSSSPRFPSQKMGKGEGGIQIDAS